MEQLPDALKPKTEDQRDRILGAAYSLPKLSEIPSEFSHTPISIGDQLGSFFCTGFATCGCSALQEGEPLVFEFSYAVNGEIAGSVSMTGYELRTAMQGHRKIGAIAEVDRPLGFKLGNKDESFLADLKNWPDLKDKALKHSKSSFLSVEGPYDAFDNIRAAIWLFRKEKRGVVFGVRWSWPMNNPQINTPNDYGSGHALYACGFKGDYLVVPNSYGRSVGDNGVFYIHRNVINKFVPIYGAFMFVDLTKEEYDQRVEALRNGTVFTILTKISLVIPLLSKLIDAMYPKPVEPAKPIENKPMPEEKVESPAEKLYRVSKASLGKKLSPKNPVLGCAEALNAVHKIAFGDEIGGGVSSSLLWEAIKKRKDFIQTPSYEVGAVIISPTSTKPPSSEIEHGHVGICGNFQIMSNNSMTGMWDTHFTKERWESYFKKVGGYPIYYYRKVA